MMRTSNLKPGKGLKPGGPLQRKTAMSRGSGFKTPAAGAGLLRVEQRLIKSAKTAKPRKPLKSKRPKMTPIRASARGQECTLRFPGICNRNPETTAWCHSNHLEDGKGVGIKARDEEGCYGCSDCHAWLDGGYASAGADRAPVDARFDAARAESQEILRAKGLLPTAAATNNINTTMES
jgi:hypothetical protein